MLSGLETNVARGVATTELQLRTAGALEVLRDPEPGDATFEGQNLGAILDRGCVRLVTFWTVPVKIMAALRKAMSG